MTELGEKVLRTSVILTNASFLVCDTTSACACFAFRNQLGIAEGGNAYTSIEELKNIWIPYSIKMKLSKNKELEVYNWDESSEVKHFLLTHRGVCV